MGVFNEAASGILLGLLALTGTACSSESDAREAASGGANAAGMGNTHSAGSASHAGAGNAAGTSSTHSAGSASHAGGGNTAGTGNTDAAGGASNAGGGNTAGSSDGADAAGAGDSAGANGIGGAYNEKSGQVLVYRYVSDQNSPTLQAEFRLPVTSDCVWTKYGDCSIRNACTAKGMLTYANAGT